MGEPTLPVNIPREDGGKKRKTYTWGNEECFCTKEAAGKIF